MATCVLLPLALLCTSALETGGTTLSNSGRTAIVPGMPLPANAATGGRGLTLTLGIITVLYLLGTSINSTLASNLLEMEPPRKCHVLKCTLIFLVSISSRFIAKETGKALIGGAFTLIDQDGKEVRDDMFRGKLMLVFFGFTRCPDICPTTAALMTRVMEKLGDKADQVVPLLITIDPEGDTPAVLKTFLANFDKRFVGLTGTPEQVKVAAAAYKAYYAKAEGKEMVDHSSFLYLMGKDGAYLSHFPDGATDEKIAAGIQSHLN
ncbi:MAG: SCO family protein [Alphaproteobacteria bacterium]|nr:SCO family protein [Alphaproteobacteria bacterium]